MGQTLGKHWSKIRVPIIQERKDGPYLTLQQIAAKFGISRQRVEQILKQEGLPTKRLYLKHPCKQCGNEIPLNQKFCNRKCHREFCKITLVCNECETVFKRRRSDALGTLRKPRTLGAPVKLWFCTKQCQGKHIIKYRTQKNLSKTN